MARNTHPTMQFVATTTATKAPTQSQPARMEVSASTYRFAAIAIEDASVFASEHPRVRVSTAQRKRSLLFRYHMKMREATLLPLPNPLLVSFLRSPIRTDFSFLTFFLTRPLPSDSRLIVAPRAMCRGSLDPSLRKTQIHTSRHRPRCIEHRHHHPQSEPSLRSFGFPCPSDQSQLGASFPDHSGQTFYQIGAAIWISF